jgi:hypothetical protein
MPGVVLTGKSLKRNGQMKSNRILLLVLLALIIVFGAVAGYLYTANNAENKNQTQLKNNIAKDLATINKGIAQKADLDKAAADIASQLDAAKAALADINFRKAAESIEYDRILYGIADASSVRIDGLAAGAPADVKELNNTYQLTKFAVTVEGLSPEVVFSSPEDDATYIGSVVTKILDFTNKIAVSSDFDTAVIESVNINEPHPMTSEEIQGLIDGINNKIADGIRGQIDALTSQIQTDNEDTLTQEQINALIKTDTDKLVAATLAAKTPDEIKTLVDQAGIARPTAVITISIWTYKGA